MSNSYDYFSNNNVVYNINCNDCEHVYIGQTKRKLKCRVNEHKNALTNLDIKSNVAEHAFKTNHNINFNNTKIIYRETNHKARKFLEKWNILNNKTKNIQIMNDQFNASSNIPNQYLEFFN